MRLFGLVLSLVVKCSQHPCTVLCDYNPMMYVLIFVIMIVQLFDHFLSAKIPFLYVYMLNILYVSGQVVFMVRFIPLFWQNYCKCMMDCVA